MGKNTNAASYGLRLAFDGVIALGFSCEGLDVSPIVRHLDADAKESAGQ
jgi:hypothetical protein